MDRQDRLYVVGVTRQFPVPTLPIVLRQVMLVAHLADIQPVEEIGFAISLVTPCGATARPTAQESIAIEMAGEYVLVTVRDVALTEEGRYRFEMTLTGQR